MLRVSLRNLGYIGMVFAVGGCVDLPPIGGGTGGGSGENTLVSPATCEAMGGEPIYDPGDGSVHAAGCPGGRQLLAKLDPFESGDEGGICCSFSGLGEPCGPTTCGVGEVCCNESCGICTPPDGACIDLFCEPEPTGCAAVLCEEGTHCEMVDVVCITEPCPPQPECISHPTCAVVDCPESCAMVEVQCFAEPCYPIPQCVPFAD